MVNLWGGGLAAPTTTRPENEREPEREPERYGVTQAWMLFAKAL